jgi:nitrogenase molybdenum-iron protein beta chain
MSTDTIQINPEQGVGDEIEALAPRERPLLETPRHTCALGGVYATASAVPGAVPILHAGGGCGWANFFGFVGASGGGLLGDGGAMMTPCSCLLEKHVVFGGEERLRDQIRSTYELMNGDLFVTASGCIPSLIGDDVDSVVNEFRGTADRPIINVKSSGFSGTSYDGYAWFLEAVIDQLLEERPIEKGLVNILGIQPCQHIYWKGDLKEIKRLLEGVGLQVNPVFGDLSGVEALKRLPAAELNIVLNPWQGIDAAKRLQERFGTPYTVYPGTPIGPTETTRFIRHVAEHITVDKAVLESWIESQTALGYQDFGYIASALYMGFCNVPFAVVGDSNIAIGLVRYFTNECGLLPAVVVLTDDPPEEARQLIIDRLTKELEGVVVPDVFFENDTYLIHKKLANYTFLFLFASSMEKYAAGKKFLAGHHTVAFPAYDRIILRRTYSGYNGGNALLEDVLSKFSRPF